MLDIHGLFHVIDNKCGVRNYNKNINMLLHKNRCSTFMDYLGVKIGEKYNIFIDLGYNNDCDSSLILFSIYLT